MTMTMDTLNTIAEAFEDGIHIMSAGLSEILTDLACELTEKHRSGAELLAQPTISAFADVSSDGGVGIMLRFGEREIVANSLPTDATGFRLDSNSTYLHLAEDVRSLIPIMSARDYILNLLHRGRPRLHQRQKGESA